MDVGALPSGVCFTGRMTSSPKTVILAGGLGSRLAEETDRRPKPMVEVGGRPILWHILKLFGAQGFTDFTLALGYKGEEIKRWVLGYRDLSQDLRVDLRSGRVEPLSPEAREPWTIDLVDTGQQTNTGGRLLRLRAALQETFFLTYGDGVADIDLNALLTFHRAQGRIATVTAVRPPARFGGLEFDGDLVDRFEEKPQVGEGWINGGFLVMEPEIFDWIEGDESVLEYDVLPRLAAARQLAARRHDGFWQCMDTLREKRYLDSLWSSGQAPWRRW